MVGGLTSGVAAISAGDGHSCAVKTDGSLWCWGANYQGELGDGTLTSRTAPTPVLDLPSEVASVSAGSSDTCAVMTDGTVWCWGNDGLGALGDGTSGPLQLVPVRVELELGARAVSAGYTHTCALATDGSVWCWGDDSEGEVDGVPEACDAARCPSPLPTRVSGLPSGVVAITAGYFWSCALEHDGTVWCWGGELGNGRLSGNSLPQRVLPCGN